jgi:hypothetical protein
MVAVTSALALKPKEADPTYNLSAGAQGLSQGTTTDPASANAKNSNSTPSAAPTASTSAAVCTVAPNNASSSSAKQTATSKPASGSDNGSGVGVGAGAQVNNVYTVPTPAKTPGAGAGGNGSTSSIALSILIHLDPGMTNASEIAPKIKSANPNIVDATAVSPSEIAVIFNSPQKSTPPPNVTPKVKAISQAGLTPQNAATPSTGSSSPAKAAVPVKSTPQTKPSAPVKPAPPVTEAGLELFARPFERASPEVFAISLPTGTGKACDVANALVNAVPEIESVTAVDDSRLLVTASTSPNQPSSELIAHVRDLAGKLATLRERPADTIVHRLYYVHDPVAVAKLIDSAYSNVQAQALQPDRVVLSDSIDPDEDSRWKALSSAERTIAKLDQPHPQVSVDAWSLQLATKDKDELHKVIPKLENLAAAYNDAIDSSIGGGWTFLSRHLSNSNNLDPFLRDYLTSTSRVHENGIVERSASGLLPQTTHGYGLGFATLYYPLTPNLIDMLVSLSSVQTPTASAQAMLAAMGTPPPVDASLSCREQDEHAYSGVTQPDHFHMACVYRALLDRGGLLAPSPGPNATSQLGQLRGALADFLFHYKLMVEYSDEFHLHQEPIAADTLDSAFAPVVSAFNEDLSVFQANLQSQVARVLRDDRQFKGITYGYGGLVSLKVLGNQPGSVNTATQNYFDATPAPTLNDLFSNLQTEGTSVQSSPLSSLVTSLAPEKAVELLTVLGQTLTPKPTTAHLGRGLDMTVTAHTLSGAYGAELDLSVQSTENGAGLTQAGGSTVSDDLNSRVSQHSVDTHVRINSFKLFNVSTLSSTLARGQAPWKPIDPAFEIPALGFLIKRQLKPKEVYTQSLVFVDALVVPTAIDLGYGVPMIDDELVLASGRYRKLQSLRDLPKRLGNRLLQHHERVVDCLNREYIDADGIVRVQGNGPDNHACSDADDNLAHPETSDEVE